MHSVCIDSIHFGLTFRVSTDSLAWDTAGDVIHPQLIYEDKQDGFMMQYSAEGMSMWGRGLYFAHNAI